MKVFFEKLKLFLENLDKLRDQILFAFIKRFWPKKIIPNHITYVRLIIGILLFILLFYFKIEHKSFIISLFIIGILTDLLDGSVARYFKKETAFGAKLDSISDRILIIPIAVYSLLGNHKWLLLILLVLEVINGLASAYQTKDVDFKGNIFGKVKMVLQSIVFGAILIVWPASPNIFFIDILWLSTAVNILNIYLKINDLNFPKFSKQINVKNKTLN
jgi:CDP-diacylglycerol--glycerol-3-phosphate 3-phosphatidyltransferase